MSNQRLTNTFLVLIVFAGSKLKAAEFLILGPGRAYAVSANGSAIAGTDFVTDEGWLWTRDDGISVLEPLIGNEFVIPYGISADGTIIGGQSGSVAAIWTNNGIPSPIGTSAFSLVWNVSADGNAFVGTNNSRAYRASSRKEIERLDPLPQRGESFGLGLSSDGTVTVGVSRSPHEATVWVHEDKEIREIGLGRPNELDTWARYVSSDGSTVVGGIGEDIIGHWFPFGDLDEPFRWTERSGMVPLGILEGTIANTPTGISADAAVIVGNTENPGQSFMWDEFFGPRDLQAVLEEEYGVTELSGLKHLTIRAMSSDAQTLIGNMGECRGCPLQDSAWALFLDRPLNWIPGDVNHDFDVDFADFLVLASHFDQSGTWEDGDFDLSGTVDFADFLALAENFGIQPVAMVAAVPEPTTSSLLTIGLIALIRFSRRRHRNQSGEASC